jgi:hypothetical protein
METSLHRQLKSMYAGDEARTEQRLEGFRIDAIRGRQLIEIQHGSLAAIRDKISRLLERHRVLVVKPLILQKTLIRQDSKGGSILGRRRSPKVESILSLFDELVYFTRVFPHRNLVLETPLVEVEEWRYPGHGRRRRWRENDFLVEDQRLVAIHQTHCFRTNQDLLALLPSDLPRPFHSGHLAEGLQVKRWIAQRIAYVLRNCGAVTERGKVGNTRLYDITSAGETNPKRKPGNRKISVA